MVKANTLIPKEYDLIIKENGLARKIILDRIVAQKERFLFNSFLGLADEQLFLRNTILGITLVSFSFYFSISLSEIFSIPSQV